MTVARGYHIARRRSQCSVLASWRLDLFSLIPATLAFVGLLVVSYPAVANWLSQYNQAQIITSYVHQIDTVRPSAHEQLSKAQEYNKALSAGALLEANTHIPTGAGDLDDDSLNYDSILRANDSGLMGRIRVPKIHVDLPIYHGTSDEILLAGAGHLHGTSLPVGGESTRSVITAHRGLANAKMFTDLDQLEVEDTFSIEIFGEVFTYKIFDKKVVEPSETEALRAEAGRDLVTLVTCTPLGINTHRILVTGERVLPTPGEDIARVGKEPDVPFFPWWAVWIPAGVSVIGVYIWWAGLPRQPKGKAQIEDGFSG